MKPGVWTRAGCVALLTTSSAWAQVDSGTSAGGAATGGFGGGGGYNGGGYNGGGYNSGGYNSGGYNSGGYNSGYGGSYAADAGTGGVGNECTTDAECVGPHQCLGCRDGTVDCFTCGNGRCSGNIFGFSVADICGQHGGSSAYYCGNGYLELDVGEECDGTNLNGATCDSASSGALPYGKLFCSASCARVLTGCSTVPIGTSATDGSARPNACTPGQQVACACASGTRGAQICATDGARFEACSCSSEDGGARVSGCTPGQQVACACASDGSQFDPCQCSSVDGSVPASPPESEDKGGCGCHVGSAPRPASPWLAALALLALGRRARRGRGGARTS